MKPEIFVAFCKEHKNIGQGTMRTVQDIDLKHRQIFGCYSEVLYVHKEPWNVPVDITKDGANEKIKQLGLEARLLKE